jgi:hypothetical protein
MQTLKNLTKSCDIACDQVSVLDKGAVLKIDVVDSLEHVRCISLAYDLWTHFV